jgi:hypothetical protein
MAYWITVNEARVFVDDKGIARYGRSAIGEALRKRNQSEQPIKSDMEKRMESKRQELEKKQQQTVAKLQEKYPEAKIETNRFEQYMTPELEDELQKNGTIKIEELAPPPNPQKRMLKIATVNRMVETEVSYPTYKTMADDIDYKRKIGLSKGEYDPKAKTIRITANTRMLRRKGFTANPPTITRVFYTYGV